MIHPGYFGLAITVGGIVFAAGGFYVGSKAGGAHNSKEHKQMQADIENLDTVKMSASVCRERHIRIDEALIRIEANTKILVEANGHDDE